MLSNIQILLELFDIKLRENRLYSESHVLLRYTSLDILEKNKDGKIGNGSVTLEKSEGQP